MTSADVVLFNIASFIAGLFLLEYGADKFIDHTAVVAKRLNVSPTLIGLLTCGAEWEELVVVAVALSQKNSDLALGNILGSSIANVLSSFSLGLLFMNEVDFDRSSKIYTTVLLAATSLFLVILATLTLIPKWLSGSLLIVTFVVYVGSVASLIYRGTLTAPESDSDSGSGSDSDSDSDSESEPAGRNSDTDTDSDTEPNKPDTLNNLQAATDEEAGHQLTLLNPSRVKPKQKQNHPRRAPPSTPATANRRSRRPRRRPNPKPLHNHILHLLLGLFALLTSSYVLSHSATTLGAALSLSSTAVGATLLSLATTLPEKVVAVLGGARRQPGILVANTVGSNIFLVTLCGGVLVLGGDAEVIRRGWTVFEVGVVWAAAVGILGVVLLGGRRWMGGVLLGGYGVFLVVEVLMGRRVDGD